MTLQRSLLILSLVGAAALAACGQKTDTAATQAASAATETASAAAPAAAPAASEAPATAPAASATADAGSAAAGAGAATTTTAAAGGNGEALFKSTCSVCHAAGVAGAPKVGDKADWGPRIAQGKDMLYKHALEGFTGAKGVMPPKGGSTAPDADVKAAVDYMVAQAK